jgi:hypothetical protein
VPENLGQDHSFTFKVSDGTLDSTPATVSITINPVNDPPVAEPQRVTTVKDTAKAITLVATDADNKSLVYKIVTQPKNGKLEGKGADFIYTPRTGFSGTDSFSFKVNDGTSNSRITLVNITVRPNNNPPVADSQSVMVMAGQSSTIYLAAQDKDGDKLNYRIAQQPNTVLSKCLWIADRLPTHHSRDSLAKTHFHSSQTMALLSQNRV